MITPFLKKSLLLALTVALAAMMVAPAFAAETLYLSDSELNYATYNIMYDADMGKARYFTGNDEYLSRMTFYIMNGSAATTGNVTAKLYNTTAATHLPASLLETSTTNFDLSDLITGTFELIDFEFADTTLLDSSTEYCVSIEYVLFANSYRIGMAHNGDGGLAKDDTGAWATSSYQPVFYLYTDGEEGGGAPYTPPGTSSWTTYDEMIESFTAFAVPLLVILLPAMLLMFLTRRADKWLLIIGLAIGAGLGYYFGLVPLWLVFLITIGIIGMAYQSVRGGNS